MKKILKALVFAISAVASLGVTAADKASTAPAYSTTDSTIAELLDNSRTKEILDKHLPGFTAAPQIDMARGMTLKGVQAFAPDTVTDDALARIDADLAKLKSDK